MSVGRNDPCPCGSGKKHKRCCLGRGAEVESPKAISSSRLDAAQFLAEAERRRGERIFRRARGWELQLSLSDDPALGKNVFYLTAMLYPFRRSSTGSDWEALGEMNEALGAPRDPILPWADFAPFAPHHFAWSASTRMPIDVPEFAKDALRALQRDRFGDPAAWTAGHGPCARCATTAIVTIRCKFCNKTYSHCEKHAGEVSDLMGGHGLRLHPERLPSEVIQKLLGDETSLAYIRKEAAKDPESWEKLTTFLAKTANLHSPRDAS